MKKNILVLIIPFLLTGCASVKYDLTISKDLTITENVNLSATVEHFNSYYKNLPRTVVEQYYNDQELMSIFKNNNYSYDMIIYDTVYPYVLVNKKYNSLNEYSNNTVFKNQSFKDIITITNDNLITIKTEDFLPYVIDEDNDRYPISILKVNIKLPFVVVENNADIVDKKTNTYTWSIDSTTKEKEISITFDKDRIYIYNLVMYISMIILIILIIILIIVIIKIVKKNKRNNRLEK